MTEHASIFDVMILAYVLVLAIRIHLLERKLKQRELQHDDTIQES